MKKISFRKNSLTLLLVLSLLLSSVWVSETTPQARAKATAVSNVTTVNHHRNLKCGLKKQRKVKRVELSHSEYQRMAKKSRSAWKGVKQYHNLTKNKKLSAPVAGDTSGWSAYGNYYYYNQLNADERAYYDRMFSCCLDFMTNGEGEEYENEGVFMPPIEVGNANVRMADDLTFIFRYSNPEFYYLNTSTLHYYDRDTREDMIALNVYRDFKTAESRQKATPIVKSKIDDTLAKITGDTEYEKVKSIHDTIARMTRYSNHIGLDNYHEIFDQTIYSVIMMDDPDDPLQTETVCAGYSSMFELLCNKLGIDAIVVTSDVHEWNRVKIDDVWYSTDVTWDDIEEPISFDYKGQSYTIKDTAANTIIYDCFLRSEKSFTEKIDVDNKTEGAHKIDNTYNDFYLPPCTHDLGCSDGDFEIKLPSGEIYLYHMDYVVADPPPAPPAKTASDPKLNVSVGKSTYKLSFTGKGFDKVYYTTDGTEPKVGQSVSTIYAAPFSVPFTTKTIKVRTVRDGYRDSVSEFVLSSAGKKGSAPTAVFICKAIKTSGKVFSVSSASILKKGVSISIPNVITSGGKKYKVTAIDPGAFYGKKKIKSITLGNNIKKIGKNAFKNIASGVTFKIKSGKKDFKRIRKLIKKSGKLPKKVKFVITKS